MTSNHQPGPGGLILPPGVQSPAAPAPDFLDREYGGVYRRQETSQGDILDSEILQLEAIFEDMLYRYSAKAFNVEEFEREAKERGHSQLGIAITVSWRPVMDTATGKIIEGKRSPKIEIAGRVEKKAFDHDRKVHEVTRDILDLGTQGVIASEEATRGGHPH